MRVSRMVSRTIVAGLLGALAFVAGAEAAEPWKTLFFSGNGDAGSWVIGHRSFPSPLTSLNMRVRFRVEAETPPGVPLGIFVAEPARILDAPAGRVYWPSGHLLSKPEGGSATLELDESLRSFIFGGTYIGVMFAIASTGEWTAEVSFERTDQAGDTVSPAFLSSGSGVMFVPHAESLLPVRTGVGSLTLTAEVPGDGWSHLHIIPDRIYPLSVRNYDIRFGTAEFNGRYEALWVPVPGGYRNDPKAVGTTRDETSTFRARLDYVETSRDVDLAFIHFPLRPDDFPPGVDRGRYIGYERTRAWHEYLGLPDPYGPLPIPSLP